MRIGDPGSGALWPLDPGSGISFFPDPKSNQELSNKCLVKNTLGNLLKSFYVPIQKLNFVKFMSAFLPSCWACLS